VLLVFVTWVTATWSEMSQNVGNVEVKLGNFPLLKGRWSLASLF